MLIISDLLIILVLFNYIDIRCEDVFFNIVEDRNNRSQCN